MNRALPILLLVPLVAAACDNPFAESGPCGSEDACEVEGSDLALAAELISTLRVDATTGYPIVEPMDTIEVRFEVVNRGSMRSARATVGELESWQLDVVIPPLEPGERATGIVRVPIRTAGTAYGGALAVYVEGNGCAFYTGNLGCSDGDWSNDYAGFWVQVRPDADVVGHDGGGKAI